MLKFKKRPAREEESQEQTQQQARTQNQTQALKQSRPLADTPLPEESADSCGACEDEIRPLAYRKWEEAGFPVSDGLQFWLAAEREILHGR